MALIATIPEFDQLAANLHTLRKAIQQEKRQVYTNGGGDIYRNFRLGAIMCGSTTGTDLAHHLVKQANAVVVLLTNPEIDDAEKATRFADLMNYTELAYVIWTKGKQHEEPLEDGQ
jgi:hypothetical protein